MAEEEPNAERSKTFELPYPEAGEYLESWIREEYETLLQKVREIGESNPSRALRIIGNVYMDVEKSVPVPRARERARWASDVLKVYRNIAAAYSFVTQQRFSLPQNYTDVLEKHEIDESADLEDRLDKLKKLKMVLENKKIGETPAMLEAALEERADLLEKQSDIEKVLSDI